MTRVQLLWSMRKPLLWSMREQTKSAMLHATVTVATSGTMKCGQSLSLRSERSRSETEPLLVTDDSLKLSTDARSVWSRPPRWGLEMHVWLVS